MIVLVVKRGLFRAIAREIFVRLSDQVAAVVVVDLGKS
jgi:hypothetical protein